MKNLPYPLQMPLENIILRHVHDAGPTSLALFHTELLELFGKTPPTLVQFAQTKHPLVDMVEKVQQQEKLSNSPQIDQLKKVYIQAVRSCLKEIKETKETKATKATHTTKPGKLRGAIVAPIETIFEEPSSIEPVLEELSFDIAPPEVNNEKPEQVSKAKKQSLHIVPKVKKMPVQKQIDFVAQLAISEKGTAQELLNAVQCREVKTPAWSQIVTVEAVKHYQHWYVTYFNFAITVIGAITKLPMQLSATHLQRLQALKRELSQIKEVTSDQHPMLFRAQEQQQTQRVAYKGAFHARNELMALLEEIC